jgi:hypothetical protein
MLGHDPRQRVHAAARGDRHDDAHRPRRELLRSCLSNSKAKGKRQKAKGDCFQDSDSLGVLAVRY